MILLILYAYFMIVLHGIKLWFEKENRTYFGIPGEEKEFILGFTLRVTQSVVAGTTGPGGWKCDLKHMNHKDKIL